MKTYDVFYQDGIFAERIEFDESCTEDFINGYLRKTVEEYNKNSNEDYHITMENIVAVTE